MDIELDALFVFIACAFAPPSRFLSPCRSEAAGPLARKNKLGAGIL